MSAYAVIALFSLFVVVCLALFLWFFLCSESAPAPDDTASHPLIAGLSAANFHYFDRLLGIDDYRKLHARRELASISARFRQDRRRIALLWLRELQQDVQLVWEFRRFLVLNGLQVTLGEEFRIACAACAALTYLEAVRFIVFFCGPFTLVGVLRTARWTVEQLSSRGNRLLARAPAAVRAKLEQEWTQHVITWNQV